ncbi:Uncharacterized protein Adt_10985 [Abeliophyllum distichum]|uniref:Uncharacterized protein n=1 Tax=Abeliophyllum distichum TaxID=126358 RepID=A0ABD1ULK3_9LAMI
MAELFSSPSTNETPLFRTKPSFFKIKKWLEDEPVFDPENIHPYFIFTKEMTDYLMKSIGHKNRVILQQKGVIHVSLFDLGTGKTHILVLVRDICFSFLGFNGTWVYFCQKRGFQRERERMHWNVRR